MCSRKSVNQIITYLAFFFLLYFSWAEFVTSLSMHKLLFFVVVVVMFYVRSHYTWQAKEWWRSTTPFSRSLSFQCLHRLPSTFASLVNEMWERSWESSSSSLNLNNLGRLHESYVCIWYNQEQSYQLIKCLKIISNCFHPSFLRSYSPPWNSEFF